jgi:hypothetical protein
VLCVPTEALLLTSGVLEPVHLMQVLKTAFLEGLGSLFSATQRKVLTAAPASISAQHTLSPACQRLTDA